jgi:hypothetical protein
VCCGRTVAEQLGNIFVVKPFMLDTRNATGDETAVSPLLLW